MRRWIYVALLVACSGCLGWGDLPGEEPDTDLKAPEEKIEVVQTPVPCICTQVMRDQNMKCIHYCPQGGQCLTDCYERNRVTCRDCVASNEEFQCNGDLDNLCPVIGELP